MSNIANWKFVGMTTVMLLAAAFSMELAVAQPKAAKEERVAKAPAKAKGRLPPYYKDIVDQAQKDKIYTLQADYKSKMEALESQLAQLELERDAAIENVLTPEQKEKLKKAKEAAATKRKKPAETEGAGEAKSE